jgi:hypothetical protein
MPRTRVVSFGRSLRDRVVGLAQDTLSIPRSADDVLARARPKYTTLLQLVAREADATVRELRLLPYFVMALRLVRRGGRGDALDRGLLPTGQRWTSSAKRLQSSFAWWREGPGRCLSHCRRPDALDEASRDPPEVFQEAPPGACFAPCALPRPRAALYLPLPDGDEERAKVALTSLVPTWPHAVRVSVLERSPGGARRPHTRRSPRSGAGSTTR